MLRFACIAGVLVASSLTARADDHPRLEGAVGVRIGSFLVDNADVGRVTQPHLDGGLRMERLLVYGEYDFMQMTYPGPVYDPAAMQLVPTSNGKGLMHRLGANARYSFGHAGDHDGGADMWVEGGLGLEHIGWDAGGTWDRPDLAFGIGGMVWGAGRERHGGVSLGLRVTLAHRNDVAHAPAACGGPCDTPTPPTGWDRSFLFDMTVLFGK